MPGDVQQLTAYSASVNGAAMTEAARNGTVKNGAIKNGMTSEESGTAEAESFRTQLEMASGLSGPGAGLQSPAAFPGAGTGAGTGNRGPTGAESESAAMLQEPAAATDPEEDSLPGKAEALEKLKQSAEAQHNFQAVPAGIRSMKEACADVLHGPGIGYVRIHQTLEDLQSLRRTR
jgi:hypothetical protein